MLNDIVYDISSIPGLLLTKGYVRLNDESVGIPSRKRGWGNTVIELDHEARIQSRKHLQILCDDE